MLTRVETGFIPPMEVGHDPWLTVRQSCDYTQLHDDTLRREIRLGRLRHARVGGRKSIRIRRSWLDAWLESSSTPVEVR